ncbi:MAG: Uma2 family endonuclease [Gemmatimonadaceae bacterium]
MQTAARKRWTAREVRQLIADNPLKTPRYELVDGELLVTSSPPYRHQEAVARLLVALRLYLEREPVGDALDSPSDIELEPEDVRQPDVYVVPLDERDRLRIAGFPAFKLMLAIEVLSPSSGRHDRVRKRSGYQRHVPQYWIVDTDARLVERWVPGEDRPEIVTETLEWAPVGARTPFVLDLPDFFRRVWGE